MNIHLIMSLKEIKGYGNNKILELISSNPITTDLHNFLESCKNNGFIKKLPSLDMIQEAKEKATRRIESINKTDVKIISYLCDVYPNRLKAISNPPLILYCRGNYELLMQHNITAIIGSREITEQSKIIINEFCKELVKKDFTIVSGLALGCDYEAHLCTLKNKGSTIAVLPSGIDSITPRSNIRLADDIITNNGCIISEYPPNTRVFKSNYIDRNRIVSALSKGVIVIQSKEKSGTRHTVQFALNQNKLIIAYDSPDYLNLNDDYSFNKIIINDNLAYPVKNYKSLVLTLRLLELRKDSDVEYNSKNLTKDYLQLNIFTNSSQ